MTGRKKQDRRPELHNEVWSIAINQLAKKYGLFDVGLAKIYRNTIFFYLSADIGPERKPAKY